jgi:hypothetical protein
MTNEQVALFRNFSSEPFDGQWGGATETFQPGESKYMEAWKANHYAKHLANRELIRDGHETHTSPKNPGQDVIFMSYLNKAMIVDEKSTADAASVHSDVINRNEQRKRGNIKNVSNELDTEEDDFEDEENDSEESEDSADEESEESEEVVEKTSKKAPAKKPAGKKGKSEEDDFEGTK